MKINNTGYHLYYNPADEKDYGIYYVTYFDADVVTRKAYCNNKWTDCFTGPNNQWIDFVVVSNNCSLIKLLFPDENK